MLTGKLVCNEETGKYEHVETEPQAEMEQLQALGGITKLEVMGLPLGAVGIGAGITILVDRFVLPRLSDMLGAQTQVFGNLGIAFVLHSWGRKMLGSKVTDAAVFLLVYEAIADTLAGWLPGGMESGTAASAQQYLQEQAMSGRASHQQVPVSGFYTKVLGG